MTSQDLGSRIRALSLRGRMAFATRCVEAALRETGTESEQMRSICEVFWAFVEQGDVAWWDDHRRTCDALMSICDYLELGTPIPTELGVGQLPLFVMQMVHDTDSLGLEELYGAIRGHSEATAELLCRVVNNARLNGVALPQVHAYGISPFTENDGWGAARHRNAFPG